MSGLSDFRSLDRELEQQFVRSSQLFYRVGTLQRVANELGIEAFDEDMALTERTFRKWEARAGMLGYNGINYYQGTLINE